MALYHRYHGDQKADHTGIAAQWPDGMDCEMFSREALEIAQAEATLPSDREHVTPYIWRHPERFVLKTLPCPFDLHDVQWSVDTSYDLLLLENLLKRTLPRTGLDFTWQDLWGTLQLSPHLKQEMQARTQRNHAYTEQVAKEHGTPVQSWESLRYATIQPIIHEVRDGSNT
jgi:spore coat polysaccharide biosynthesis protein SpsF (cytidylyltransferase family)